MKKSDAELNSVYNQIAQRLRDDAETTKVLVAAQRSWVAFRDAECTLPNSRATDGGVYPMNYSMCLDGLTQLRTKELKVYLNCEEGDMRCPVPAATDTCQPIRLSLSRLGIAPGRKGECSVANFESGQSPSTPFRLVDDLLMDMVNF